MTKLRLSAVALTILLTACKKGQDDSASGLRLGGNWKVGTHSYSAHFTFVVKTDTTYAVQAVDSMSSSSFSSITFFFKGPVAPAPGSYRLVSRYLPVSTGQVSFATVEGYGTSDKASWLYVGNDDIYATVTDSAGKVRISLPDTWVEKSAITHDNVQVSANIIQTR